VLIFQNWKRGGNLAFRIKKGKSQEVRERIKGGDANHRRLEKRQWMGRRLYNQNRVHDEGRWENAAVWEENASRLKHCMEKSAALRSVPEKRSDLVSTIKSERNA